MKLTEQDKYLLTPSEDDSIFNEAVGEALRVWFSLYKQGKTGFLNAGSQKGTDLLTIVLHSLVGKNKYCTFATYQEVATCFIREIEGMTGFILLPEEIDNTETTF
jgi:hypothetical protein